MLWNSHCSFKYDIFSLFPPCTEISKMFGHGNLAKSHENPIGQNVSEPCIRIFSDINPDPLMPTIITRLLEA